MSVHDGETDAQIVDRVVLYWCKKFRGTSARESTQVAWIELLESRQRFDPNNAHGATWSTFVITNIKFALIAHYNDASRITNGAGFKKVRPWVRRNSVNGTVDLAAFRENWPKFAKLSDDEIRHGVVWCLRGEVGIDVPRGHAERTIADTLRAPEAEKPPVRDASLAQFVSGLSAREKAIFERRLFADEPERLQDVGNTFGVCRERVRQIEARLIEKLRAFVANDAERWIEGLRPSAKARVRKALEQHARSDR